MPALTDGSEYAMDSDVPGGEADYPVNYCQTLYGTDIIC
jgi:hypothetical protein